MSQELSFGHWLRQRRHELDLTQMEVAERTGCSLDMIQKIESGKRRPSRQVAELLAGVIGVPADEREIFVRFARSLRGGLSLRTPDRDGEDEAEAATSGADAAPSARSNLPSLLTPLLGRAREIDEVRATLLDPRTRLLTLTGPPGIGKTSLALQAAAGLGAQFADGVFLVPLSPLVDPALVMAAVVRELGVTEVRGRSALDVLSEFIHDKALLLLLDNFEQVLAAAPHVAELLGACPNLKVVATSREALHLSVERQYPVPPLALPDPSASASADDLAACPSVALFVDRAQAIRPDFELTEKNAADVAAICSRLDGLPLAIELAAARLKLLPPHEILSRLDQRLKLLTGGARDLSPRQQTLRGAIEWSYELLDERERMLFTVLGLFVGGCTLEQAEALTGEGGDALFVFDGVVSLVDKSLLRQEEMPGGEPRFYMLDTIREYALEVLRASGQYETAGRRHCDIFLAMAEDAEPGLRSPRQAEWLKTLEIEHGNMGAAIAWAVGRGDCLKALRVAGALWRFWYMRSYLTEGRRLLGEALACLGGEEPPEGDATFRKAYAKALNGAGSLAYTQGDYEAAQAMHERSIAVAEALGDDFAVAASANNLGLIARVRGDYPRARALFEQALATNRRINNPSWEAINLNNLANVTHDLGDYERARVLQEESLAIFTRLNDRWGVGMVLVDLGKIATSQGDYPAAFEWYERGLRLQNEVGDRRGAAGTLSQMGFVEWNRGDYPRGLDFYEESLRIFEDLGDRGGIASALNGLGHLRVVMGEYDQARSLYLQSLAIREELGYRYETAASYHNLGYLAIREGDNAAARPILEKSVDELRRLGDRWALAFALSNMARLAMDDKEFALARQMLDESVALCHEVNNRRGLVYALGELARLAVCEGDLAAARALYIEKMQICLRQGIRWDLARSLLGLARVWWLEGDLESAAHLYGATEAMREAMGAMWEVSVRDEVAAALAAAVARAGEETVARLTREGQAMTQEQAVALALGPAAG